MSYQELFKAALLTASNNKESLPEAVAEFSILSRIELLTSEDSFEHCICSHEIKELCFMKSSETGKEILVGNKCVKRFFPSEVGEKTKVGFRSLRRITKDCTACKKRYHKAGNLDSTALCEYCRVMKTMVQCVECHAPHAVPKKDASWKKRCLPCYKRAAEKLVVRVL